MRSIPQHPETANNWGDRAMMAAVFATMFLALVLGWIGWRALAIASLTACLVLSVWLFLFEIYSPDYGFRMPWIKTELPMPQEGA
jgi:hypothetical protein